MPKAVIYARFSSHNQREESIEQQVAECKAFAAAKNLTVIDIYSDSAISGRSDRRPQFQRLRRDASKNIFEYIIAYKSSRIARNMLNALNFEVEMTKQGVTVLYAKEEFGDNAAGRFALRTMMSVNQFYSENLGEDIKRTQADNAQNCRANGPAPFGYKSDADGHFVIDEPAAKLIQEIFARIAAGELYVTIINDFNRRGLKTSRGTPWTKNSFQSILSNERYMGIYIFDGVRVPGGMPQIIEPNLYQEVQQAVKNRKKKSAASEYQLTGKLYCGECGEYMVGMCGTGKSGNVYYYYACSGHRNGSGCKKTSVGRDQIETAVAKSLCEKIMSDDIINQIADEVMDYQRKHKDNPEIKALEAQKADTEKSIKNILAAIEAGIITASTKARLMELEAEQTKITEQLAVLTTDQINVTRDQVVGYLKSYRGGDIDDKKYRMKLFQTFLTAVYVYDDRLKVVFDPLGGGNNCVDITLDDISGMGDGVRLCATLGHHIGLRRTPYIVFMVSLVTK